MQSRVDPVILQEVLQLVLQTLAESFLTFLAAHYNPYSVSTACSTSESVWPSCQVADLSGEAAFILMGARRLKRIRDVMHRKARPT
jgi:hypothetical protein